MKMVFLGTVIVIIETVVVEGDLILRIHQSAQLVMMTGIGIVATKKFHFRVSTSFDPDFEMFQN